MALSSEDLLMVQKNSDSSPRVGVTSFDSNCLNHKSNLEISDLPIYRNVLFLQGPVGPFFSKLAQFLRQPGTKVHKVNFNPGDEWFYSAKEPNTFLYDFTLEYWPEYLERFLTHNQIEAIFVFGECRPIHLPAKSLCKNYDIDFWVFEEGYYRPNFFTMEYFGVNANSMLYKTSIEPLLTTDKFNADNLADTPIQFSRSRFFMTKHAIIYWLANIIQPYKCANYDHHRQLNFLIACRWIKNFLSLWLYKIKDRSILRKIFDHQSLNKNYFLLPLQVHDDSQMTHHSDFQSVEEVIHTVVISFYEYLTLYKNSTTKLIIKHHPMDRGHKNYSLYIKTLTKTLGISDQVYYLHDLDLNAILPLCKGCITVNSTLGLKALDSGVPVINLGRSFYDKQHLTSQNSLHEFWVNPGSVNPKYIQAFKRILMKKTQINGCLYSPEYQMK